MTVVASSTHVRVAVDHTLIAKIGKVKDLALILLTGVFNLPSLHLLSKSILSNVLLHYFYSLTTV